MAYANFALATPLPLLISSPFPINEDLRRSATCALSATHIPSSPGVRPNRQMGAQPRVAASRRTSAQISRFGSPNEAFLAIGMRDYWDGYFADRAAPLGMAYSVAVVTLKAGRCQCGSSPRRRYPAADRLGHRRGHRAGSGQPS